MAREKWERRAYGNMTLLCDKENVMMVETMSKDEEKNKWSYLEKDYKRKIAQRQEGKVIENW